MSHPHLGGRVGRARAVTNRALIASLIAAAVVTGVPRQAHASNSPAEPLMDMVFVGILVGGIGLIIGLGLDALSKKPAKPSSLTVAPTSSRAAASELCIRF
jgi:hypothetical protein